MNPNSKRKYRNKEISTEFKSQNIANVKQNTSFVTNTTWGNYRTCLY